MGFLHFSCKLALLYSATLIASGAYGQAADGAVSDPKAFTYRFQGHLQGPKGSTVNQTTLGYDQLRGHELEWHDSILSPSGSLTIDGTASKGVIRIHYKGNIAVTSDKEQITSRLGYNDIVIIHPPTRSKSITAYSQIRGTVSYSSTSIDRGLRSEAGVTVGSPNAGGTGYFTISDRDRTTYRKTGEKEVLASGRTGSKSENIDTSQTSRLDLPIGWSGFDKFPLTAQREGSGAVGDVGFLHTGLGQVTLEASSMFEGSAQASIDVTLIVLVSADGAPLPKQTSDSEPSPLHLLEATSPDPQTVALLYDIQGKKPLSPFQVRVYRSKEPILGTEDVNASKQGDLLDEKTVSDPENLKPGDVHVLRFLEGKKLLPDPDKPYISVVTISDGKTSAVYFRKWLLGAVVHGYPGIRPTDWKNTMAWVTAMANTLKTANHFDEAIPLDWIATSWVAAPGKAEEAGELLYKKIAKYVDDKGNAHLGDVVDIHLIGHSRGTVVISQALQLLEKMPFAGSQVFVTLLDIHPANTSSDTLSSIRTTAGDVINLKILAIDRSANDAEITLPANAGITSVEIWYQHTLATTMFGSDPTSIDGVVNLWGQSKLDNRLRNQGDITIDWHDLTSPPKSLHPISHEGIHELYFQTVVRPGKMHRMVGSS